MKLPYLAEDFDGRRHFLLADFFVFLLFRGGFEALPRQRGLVEIHENVTQTLHVIPEEKRSQEYEFVIRRSSVGELINIQQLTTTIIDQRRPQRLAHSADKWHLRLCSIPR